MKDCEHDPDAKFEAFPSDCEESEHHWYYRVVSYRFYEDFCEQRCDYKHEIFNSHCMDGGLNHIIKCETSCCPGSLIHGCGKLMSKEEAENWKMM